MGKIQEGIQHAKTDVKAVVEDFEARSEASAAKARADNSMHEKLAELQKGEHPETPSVRFAKMKGPEVLQELNTPSLDSGLSHRAVERLRSEYGSNELKGEEDESKLLKFLGQFYESPLNLMLFGSAGVSCLLGNYDDAISISLAIIIVVTVGFVQEERSEKSLQALNQLVPHYCRVLRDSRWTTELGSVLVPGDVVSFTTGDRVPADIRLLHASDLEIDESNLTGETRPAEKTTEPIADRKDGHVPDVSERTNTAFMGTLVKAGRGTGVVVSTGDKTEFGVIFSMMQEIEDRKTPLQENMDNLAQQLSFASFVVIGIICLIGVYQKRSWLEMFTIGVSLAVAAIPEGLPIVVTVTLALGVLRMSKRQAIVKKLPSVETLGSVSVICSDKTGTLTTNEMTVARIYTVEDGIVDVSQGNPGQLSTTLQHTLLVGNICNHSFLSSEGVYTGQSTEVALMNSASSLLGRDERERLTKFGETPFNSEQKWQSVSGTHPLIGNGTERLVFLTGAPETVVASCNQYAKANGTVTSLDEQLSNSIIDKGVQLAGEIGVRVVAMAYGPAIEGTSKSLRPSGYTFAGWQAMLDPPRGGVMDAIAELNQAGVTTVMITGDAESTARSIAAHLGINVHNVMTGKDIDQLSTEQLAERIEDVNVFARTTPRHKMSIISAFQMRGKIVAMTGDGVNDAPALKLADIGISMGRGGTDVAKEAADMILVDDNFATILPAVEEGKGIFWNIQNFLCFQLSTAVAALALVTISTALELPNPLNPMQILFINILMDGPPSQSLGVDPVDEDVMKRPPRPKDEPVLSMQLLLRIAFSACMVVFGTLFIYVHELSDGELQGRDQTMTFTGFVLLDLISAIQNRGLSCGLFANRMLILTCGISFTVQLIFIYFGPLQNVFQTESLCARDMGVLLAIAGTSFTLHEIRRRYERRLSRKSLKLE